MKSDQNSPQLNIPHSPYLPYDESVSMYNTAFVHLTPYTFSNFQQESMSWKNTCYLHAGLNPAYPYSIKGEDALRLFKDSCVNTFEIFAIGSARHAIMCNEQGNIMADGLLLHIGEDEYISYYLSPYINYLVDSGAYDVVGEDLSGEVFLFQLGGPRSLEVLEAATGESLRDLLFFKHRPGIIKSEDENKNDADIRIFRVGVAGTLAYEVHGNIKDAEVVYQAIIKAGEHFRIEKLGLQVYGMNHTENGFYQSFIHFMGAYPQDQRFMDYLNGSFDQFLVNISGSAGRDLNKRFCNPVEAGWSNRIVFDHDFRGRQALEKAIANPVRRIVTLLWNPDDIAEVQASFFETGETYQYMELAANPIWTVNNSAVISDDVLKDGEIVGISSGRIYSFYSRSMISLCLVNIEYGEPGTELEVVWGEPGSRQKKIRVIVSRFPFLDLPRNKEIDVSCLPS